MKKFANVEWTAGDIQTLRPEWSVEKCEDFLVANEHHLRDRLIEVGWEVLEVLLTYDAAG